VAALFSALAGASFAVGEYATRRQVRAAIPGLVAAAASLLPVLMLAVAFPEGGSEPFTLATFWPIPAIGLVALALLPRGEITVRVGIILYVAGSIAAYLITSPVGSNAARLMALTAGPLAALFWWPRRRNWLILLALPLLWLQWEAPIRDVSTSAGDPSISTSYYRPLLGFLARQPGPPFRVEIPFTRFHWEAYQVAPRFPLARGWERQLDLRYDRLFYGGPLTAGSYKEWLHALGVRFVAVPDAPLDFSSHKEAALIARGLSYLHLVYRTAHWRVYRVAHATPIVEGAASLTQLGPNSVTLKAKHAGSALVRVRFSPYWALVGGAGCVMRKGDFVSVKLRSPGVFRLVMSFSLSRIGADSPRCSGASR
jgi:hypothetical protein